MEIQEAADIQKGDYVISPHTSPPFKPLRVSVAWCNKTHTIVRFRIHQLGDIWIDASAVESPPHGKIWNKLAGAWVTPAPPSK